MTHRNAVLTPWSRYRLVMRVQAGRPIAHVAAEDRVSVAGIPDEPRRDLDVDR